MKKSILFVVLILFTITNNFSTPPRIIKSKQKYNGLNGAGAWFMIAGGSLFVGGIAKVVGNGQTPPDIKDYSTIEAYNKSLNKYDHNQDLCNNVFGAGIGIAGLSFIFAGADMFFASRNLKLNEQTTMNLRTNKNGLTLCLNFH